MGRRKKNPPIPVKPLPHLQPSEVEAIREAARRKVPLTRSKLPLGSYEAKAGRSRLFCTGSEESFEALWLQAERIYNE